MILNANEILAASQKHHIQTSLSSPTLVMHSDYKGVRDIHHRALVLYANVEIIDF